MAAAAQKEENALYPPQNAPYPPPQNAPYPPPQQNAAPYPPPPQHQNQNQHPQPNYIGSNSDDQQQKAQKTKSKDATEQLDLHNRDPHDLNPFLRLTFHDVIGEPEPGVFSSDGVYKCSYNTYTITKLWCYRILAYICNVPLAVFWALWFGCFSYMFIWVCVPLLRCCRVQCRCIGELNKACLDACIGPFCDAFGRCLGQIHVRHSRYSSSIPDEPDPAEKRDAAHLA